MSELRAGAPLHASALAEIRRTMELSHCKWDAQVGDQTTLADFPLLLRRSAEHRKPNADRRSPMPKPETGEDRRKAGSGVGDELHPHGESRPF